MLAPLLFTGDIPLFSEDDIRRLTWQSRRGMWELDLLFVPFMEEAFRELQVDDQQRFVRLLDCEDQELFMWFMQREVPDNSDTQRIVSIVLEFIRKRNNK